jgi:2-polyprenyl-6-methoxyphenol hydroxylase-like FAD-dependent oxidoreductase
MRIAINGAGIGGPTLAYWLRRAGHEPVLYEQAPSPRTGGYVVDFWGLGYAIAERMGLMVELRERGYLMEQVLMVDSHGGTQAALEVAPMRKVLDGRFISVARADLATALLGACRGIPCDFGVAIGSVEEDGAGVTATLTDGRRERFDLVVGADGLHSQVRACVFGPQAEFERSLDCYVAAYRIRGYPRRDDLTFMSHTVPQRHIARMALSDDETLVLLICRAGLIGPPPPRELQRDALRRAFGDLGWEAPALLHALKDDVELYFDRVSQIHLPRWSVGRVALVGDAAACASLLAGEGTGLAMFEAYVLAGEIYRAGGDWAGALAAYESRLRGFVTAKQRAAISFRGFFAPRSALSLALRNLSINALSIPFLPKLLYGRWLRDDLELPEYGIG